jgi:hypothetical protein
MHSVIKPWVFTLPFRMQSVLLLALRGCDGVAKDDHSKAITRTLRGLVFNNADPTNTFITEAFPAKEKVEAFLWDLDGYPMHFVMHTTHATEIVGFKHPDVQRRTEWLGFYHKAVKALHLNPETEAQLDVRLGFTDAEKAVADIPSPELLAAFQAALLADKKGFAQHIAKHGYGVADPDDEKKWDAGTGTSHGGRGRAWSGGS